MLVQFVGEDRLALRSHPDLSVSVMKLRRAFRWLSVNSWPFMEATKHHELWDTDLLDDAFEDLVFRVRSKSNRWLFMVRLLQESGVEVNQLFSRNNALGAVSGDAWPVAEFVPYYS